MNCAERVRAFDSSDAQLFCHLPARWRALRHRRTYDNKTSDNCVHNNEQRLESRQQSPTVMKSDQSNHDS